MNTVTTSPTGSSAPCHSEIGVELSVVIGSSTTELSPDAERVEQPDQVDNNNVNTDSSTSWDEEIGFQPSGQAVNHSALTSNMNTPTMSPIGSSAPQPNENSSSTEQKSRYFTKWVPLRRAAIKGNWREAKKIILQESPATLWFEPITKDGETLLHVAAEAGQTHFVRKLLERPQINYESLKELDKKHRTPFVRAVAAGAKEIVELMLNYDQTGGDHNTELLTIRCGRNNDALPLYYAALYGRGELAEFLYDMHIETRVSLSLLDKEHVFFACMDTGLYGVAQKLLKDNWQLATARHSRCNSTALHILARNPSAFSSHTTKFNIRLFPKSKPAANALSLAECLWGVMKMDINKLDLIRCPTHILYDAVRSGNLQILQMLINSDPDLVWERNEEKQTIFHLAVKYRRGDIFYLIYEFGLIKDIINSYEDNDNNNMLHLAAILPPPNRLNVIPGAALQMRQELLWYKEVEKIMDHELRDKRNADSNRTPEELFLDEHKDLRKDGEKWMNDRAQSCSVVATLIATVVFAIAFTVPGGNDQASGLAMFLNGTNPAFLKENKTFFNIFAISAAIALGASTISIIIFLSVLTSSYSYQDFVKSLPQKLMAGLLTLLFSMSGMMVAFCMAFMCAYAKNAKLIPWFIIGIEVLPIVFFVVLQSPLLYKMYCSTYGKLL